MKNKRILIYRIGSLGDTIVALPCFHLIARTFPNAERYVLTNFPSTVKEAPIKSILGDSGLINGYLKYPLYTRNFKTLLKLRSEIMDFSPDILVYLTPARGIFKALRDYLFFKICFIPKIIGVPLKMELQTHLYNAEKDLYEPESKRLSRCIQALGDTKSDQIDNWSLQLTKKEIQSVSEMIGDWPGNEYFFTCCAGTKMPSKDWGRENWGDLLTQLSKIYLKVGMVFIGSKDEFDLCTDLQNEWKGPSLNLCGELTPRESAALIKRSRLFLGHDSGPMHLASAVDTPCVAIFSARNKPAVWFPFGYEARHKVIYHKTECYGCNLVVCKEHGNKCTRTISVDEVINAIESLNIG